MLLAGMANNSGEPGSSPQPERWYDLKLGSSFKNQSSTKFCTLRYEFKPASIDKSQAGSLHKNKENRVTVEFPNNQPGKPKVTFEGSSEDYKDNDGVLFFDGETFRLERLHRAVKRLRHIRLPGESAVAAMASAAPGSSPPLGKTIKQTVSKPLVHAVPVEVERIDIGESDNPGITKSTIRSSDHRSLQPDPFLPSPDPKPDESENLDPFMDVFNALEETPDAGGEPATFEFDMKAPHQNDMDDEIADVDDSDDEAVRGGNAAEALKAQVNAEEARRSQGTSSSSSGSSGSGSSSSSSSSSSGSGGSDADTASSGGELDI